MKVRDLKRLLHEVPDDYEIVLEVRLGGFMSRSELMGVATSFVQKTTNEGGSRQLRLSGKEVV